MFYFWFWSIALADYFLYDYEENGIPTYYGYLNRDSCFLLDEGFYDPQDAFEM